MKLSSPVHAVKAYGRVWRYILTN